MSQYNKTVLTHAGLELAKRANAGQAKFGITRAVTSADDWSNKTVQDLEEVTAIPNIMQQGTIMDTDEVESNNSVIGVSLCFTNKNLSTGYQIRIIGLYVKEEGQENDFLYAVTTAITPESMPSFADKVLYKFNMQMYLVIGKAQAVNVVINEGTAVTSTQFNKYKGEVADNLKKLENTHKEDMSHVAKSASINGGAEVLPDSTGKLNLVVPDPDLSEYVSLEQLTEILQAKADKADVYTKTETDNQINKFDLSKVKFRKQYLDGDGHTADKTWSATKNDDGTYTIDLSSEDWTAAKLAGVLAQLPNKADTSTVNAQIADAKNTIKSNADNLQSAINTKANASDLSALQNSAMQVIDGNSGDDILSFRDEKIRCYNNAQNVKNLPNMSNVNWFYVITHTKNGWGNVTVISQDNCYWQNALNALNWSGWVKHATSVDITDLQNAVNSKADKSQVNVEGSLFRMLSAGNTWNDILGFDNGDAPALVAFRGNSSGPMNNLLGNYSAGVAFGGSDTKGFLEVSYADHNARIGGGNGDAPVWHEDIAWKSDIDRLQNIINQQNQTIQSLTSRLNNAENEINYIKANYVEGKRFAKSQEAQAEAWENENPQRIAFITDD